MEEKIYLKDIAGYDEEKEEANKIIEVLKNHEKYEKMGAYVPKGLILSGEPGVGKTMLAKAIANESGVPFFEFETNEGDTEAATIRSIKELFTRAREHAPSIVFIDELDELVITTGFMSDYSRKTTKILLTEIDGISASDGILVIATTNYRSGLPSALVRSGRMDKRITFEMPDTKDREEIFRLYLGKNNLLNGIDATELAVRTSGFSGADIKTLVNETIIDCGSRGIGEIRLDDFERNIPVIQFQDIRKKPRNGPSDIVCNHEIGHFLCEYMLSGTIGAISAERYGNIRGHVDFDDDFEEPEPVTRNTLESKIITLLGGMAGEEVLSGDISNGSTQDIAQARTLLHSLMNTGAFGFDRIIGSSPVNRSMMVSFPVSSVRIQAVEKTESDFLDSAYAKAKNLVSMNKSLAEVLLKNLEEKQRLSKREVESILKNFRKGQSTTSETQA